MTNLVVAAMTITLNNLNDRSKALGKQSKSLDKAIHDHAVTIAQWIATVGSGNVTPATFFLSQIGDGARKNALRQWFLDFGGCSWNAEKKAFGKKKDFVFSLINAKENPWYEYVPEPEFKPVDGEALLKATIAKMKKALADTEHANQHKVSKDMLKKLEAILTDKAPHYVQSETEPKSEAPVEPTVNKA